MSGPLRVIKLGGSLFDWSELPSSLRGWLAAQSEASNVLVAGGGGLVDALRRLDACHPLDPAAVHWLCIRAMNLTAALVAGWLGDAELVASVDELRRSLGPLQIMQVEEFMRLDARSADPLPCGWQVTSDSIAARLARTLEAQELVLLKSCLPPGAASRERLAQRGYVDEYFAGAAAGLSVRIVNLREAGFPQATID